LDEHGCSVGQPASGHPLRIRVHYRWEGQEAPPPADLVVTVNRDETMQFVLSNSMCSGKPIRLQSEGYIDMIVPSIPLASGLYSLELVLSMGGHGFDGVANAMFFEVIDGDFFGSGKVRPNVHWTNPGVLVQHHCESHGAAPVIPVSDPNPRSEVS
ncbi:MAG: hypothetical protein KTR15_14020, partial [Phycisphaeraceae bacterium]|nr:hypothetical protein [Phycisphaeraceae bacterium]